MTTHPIDPLARGGYLVTVKRDGRATKVKYFPKWKEAACFYGDKKAAGADVTITPTGGAE